MEKFSYGTQLSEYPIELSVGHLLKPKLKDIAKITFEKFNFYQIFLKITPEKYYSTIAINTPAWDSLSEDKKNEVTMFSVILNDNRAKNIYLDIFNFFFFEKVIFREGLFILLKNEVDDESKITADDVSGVIQERTFNKVLNMIQQICCICDEMEDESLANLKFKNEKAKKNYLKMLKGQKERQAKAKSDVNLSIPNIISAVANKHPSLNMTNIWELTVFQLLDSFYRLQANAFYEIDSSRVSTWGDEKKTFDAALWYKNTYDKK